MGLDRSARRATGRAAWPRGEIRHCRPGSVRATKHTRERKHEWSTDAVSASSNGKPKELALLPRHLADLRKSGLSDAQIARCGFHSLQAPASVQAVLHWKSYRGDLGDCLAIRFVDADGKSTGYCRLKPDRPRKSNKDGKPIKYESPKGIANRAYFPPGTLSALQ